MNAGRFRPPALSFSAEHWALRLPAFETADNRFCDWPEVNTGAIRSD